MPIQKETIQFLKDLKKNNERDWFNAHKENFMAANENTRAFIQSVIGEIAKFDKSVAGLEAKGYLYRIYRDTRFAKDKTPYRTHLGATVTGAGNGGGVAGHCIHIEPGNAFLGGGVQMPEPAILKAIRQQISYQGREFLKIINDKNFKSNFTIEGEKLAKVPQGFDKEDPMAEYLKFKEFIIKHKLDDKQLTSDDLAGYCVRVFKTALPFNNFVNQATQGVKNQIAGHRL